METALTPAPDLLTRARGEFLEMPGLSLTLAQAQRLWTVDRATCAGVLGSLVRAGFLRQRHDGSFVRRGAGPSRVSHRQGGR